ncbi:hypothetical protein KIN20_007268 [Parelaphostrongylus tenuis]|uniref:Uncharacterized protein n=1 Tax=Parelaphostrongylus tenuis TaxID=148309 RepID=A0AAD5M343_PARTN|nr:hypothetical protein KIN20_007268 [Parelaphostrongylus tenuis]
MSRDDPIVEEERRAHTATQLIRMRLNDYSKILTNQITRQFVVLKRASSPSRINPKKEQNRLDYVAKVAEKEELDEESRAHRSESERIEAEQTAKKRAKRLRRNEAAEKQRRFIYQV